MQQGLARLGVQVAAHEPALTRAARVRHTLGPAGEPLARELDALAASRYGPDGASRAALAAWWRRFRSASRLVAAR